jgi:TPR repeat protein
MYENGLGVNQNYSEAVKWYQIAAGLNSASAQYNLGKMFQKSNGVPEPKLASPVQNYTNVALSTFRCINHYGQLYKTVEKIKNFNS